jgi:DNA-binding FadR family transcriptional regulator
MDLNLTTLPQIKPKRTFELIVDLLKDRILSGEFSPGDRLPAERSLAEALGVGRPSVREAYRALELMGIVDIRKGVVGGAFIKAPSQLSASETITDLLRMQHVELTTLAEARLFIERGTAELAAKRATPADIKKLTEILERAKVLMEKGEQIADLGIEFHLKIAATGGNPLLSMSLTSIMELMRRVLRRWVPPAEATQFELREHFILLDAIADGDADRAVQLMDQHLRRSMERLEGLASQRLASGV